MVVRVLLRFLLLVLRFRLPMLLLRQSGTLGRLRRDLWSCRAPCGPMAQAPIRRPDRCLGCAAQRELRAAAPVGIRTQAGYRHRKHAVTCPGDTCEQNAGGTRAVRGQRAA
jgi:hypothetical protein